MGRIWLAGLRTTSIGNSEEAGLKRRCPRWTDSESLEVGPGLPSVTNFSGISDAV